MHNIKLIKALLAASAAAMLCAVPAQAQTATNPKAAVMPPVAGEANDHTAPAGTTEAAEAAKEVKASGM